MPLHLMQIGSIHSRRVRKWMSCRGHAAFTVFITPYVPFPPSSTARAIKQRACYSCRPRGEAPPSSVEVKPEIWWGSPWDGRSSLRCHISDELMRCRHLKHSPSLINEGLLPLATVANYTQSPTVTTSLSFETESDACLVMSKCRIHLPHFTPTSYSPLRQLHCLQLR